MVSDGSITLRETGSRVVTSDQLKWSTHETCCSASLQEIALTCIAAQWQICSGFSRSAYLEKAETVTLTVDSWRFSKYRAANNEVDCCEKHCEAQVSILTGCRTVTNIQRGLDGDGDEEQGRYDVSKRYSEYREYEQAICQ